MTAPALPRLEDLTRRYATYSRGGAGLSALWGGIVFAGVAGLCAGYGLATFFKTGKPFSWFSLWWYFLREDLPAPAYLQWVIFLAPLIWWIGALGLQRWAWHRFGEVQERGSVIKKGSALAHRTLLLTSAPVVAGLFLLRKLSFGKPGDPVAFWGSMGITMLLPAMVWSMRRHGRPEDFNLAMFLTFLGGLTLNGGLGSTLAICLPFYLLGAMWGASLGTWRHWQFRKVSRELESLRGPE